MYTVTIFDTSTMQKSVLPIDYPWSDTELFMWSEGNYSCNCNRARFYDRGRGIPEQEEYPCTNIETEGKYRVVITDHEGNVLYTDENDENKE